MTGFRRTSAALAKKHGSEKKRIQNLGYEFQPEFYKSKFTIQNNFLAVIIHGFRYFLFRNTQY